MRRNFPLVLTVAVVMLTPASAQVARADSAPDLSGLWLHANPGFEPMPSGPTALVNRARRPNGTGDILRRAGDYNNPISRPEAAEVVKKHAALGLNFTGDPSSRNY